MCALISLSISLYIAVCLVEFLSFLSFSDVGRNTPAIAGAAGFTNQGRLHPVGMCSQAPLQRFIASDLDHLPLNGGDLALNLLIDIRSCSAQDGWITGYDLIATFPSPFKILLLLIPSHALIMSH